MWPLKEPAIPPDSVKVEMDANHSMEVTPESSMDSEGEDEEDDIEVGKFTSTRPAMNQITC